MFRTSLKDVPLILVISWITLSETMPLTPSEAKPGILVRIESTYLGILYSRQNRWGIILKNRYASPRVDVQRLTAINEDIVSVHPSDLSFGNDPPKKILKRYAAAHRAEVEKYQNTSPSLLASFLYPALHRFRSKLCSGDRLLLDTYGAMANQDYSAGADELRNILRNAGDQLCHKELGIDSALHESWIELAWLQCRAMKFKEALEVLKRVAHQNELAEYRKSDCILGFHLVLRSAGIKDREILGEACGEIIRLDNQDEAALEFQEALDDLKLLLL